MKKFILYFVSAVMVFFTANSAFSLPTFWYSGVAYTSAGQISPNSVLEVSVTITDGTNSYHEEYLESPGVGTATSDAFGVFSVNVGTGGSITGNLSNVSMLASTKITVRVRPVGGNWLTVTGQALINNYLNSYVTPGGIDGNDILDGSITNADISSSAAIEVTKLAAGSNGQVLLNNGGTNQWGTLAAGNVSFTPTGTIAATNVQDAIAEVSGDVAGLKTLTSGNIYVGNSSNEATSVQMSGDVTIDNTGATTIGASKVQSGMIADGTIVDEDVSATAAISGSKINPDFGTQNITTSGNISTTGTGSLTIAGTTTLSGPTNISSTFTMGFEEITSGNLTNATKSFIKYSGGATLNAATDFPSVPDGTIIQIFNSSTTFALLIDNLIGTQILITLNPSDMASFVKISSGKWALLQ